MVRDTRKTEAANYPVLTERMLMRTKKKKKSKWIIICKVGALVAVKTSKGLVMKQMEFGTEPHYFRNESAAMEAIANNKVDHSLVAVKTQEW